MLEGGQIFQKEGHNGRFKTGIKIHSCPFVNSKTIFCISVLLLIIEILKYQYQKNTNNK